MKKLTCSWFILLFFLSCLAPSLQGTEAPQAQLTLLSETKSIGHEKNILLGLRVQLKEGWKTYWRTPGVAGYAIRLDWEGSSNIKSAKILWPTPHKVHTELGIVNAYSGDIVFPISVDLIDSSQPVKANMAVNMLVCDASSCLPVFQTLTLSLPVGKIPPTDSDAAPLIRAALSKIPSTHPNEDIYIKSLELMGSEDIAPIVKVVLESKKKKFSTENISDLFIEMDGVFVDSPIVSLSKDKRFATYTSPIYPDENKTPTLLHGLIGKPVTLTIVTEPNSNQSKAFVVHQTLATQSLNLGYFAGMLLIAFIGGLILNVMPCVLPVLSLKVLSVMRHSGGHHLRVRQDFIATSLGILFSFLILAVGAIALKAGGHAVGWGIQFQEPTFVIGLVIILVLFSANLFGFFEFGLPNFISSRGGKGKNGWYTGSFLEGLLVTALATPCTAPFLGTALAFSLSRGAFEIISIFLIMGLGLSFPYLLISFFPKAVTKLPKPGVWMLRIKLMLGWFLLLTAVWLLSVLWSQLGWVNMIRITMLMGIILIVIGITKHKKGYVKNLAWIIALASIALSFTIPYLYTPSKSQRSNHQDLWQTFDPERIIDHVKAGKIVFVNVTADWCLTCQANKYFVLNTQSVLEALHQKDVVAMEADWTNYDAKISAFLESFNQHGIPFYAVFGCKNPTGLFLGQVLTPHKVISALSNERCRSES